MTQAVFFDVDFTLIYPGPTLQGEGYEFFCARRGVTVDPAMFRAAVAKAAPVLDEVKAHNYDAQVFIDYTRTIIEQMGGRGPATELAATDIYEEWAACHHFFLYDDAEPVLRALAAAGLRIGLISNTQRPLDEFASHFALDGLISASVSSAQFGYLKPHPSIFEAALASIGVPAGESVMVGDSVTHDIEGARQIGMRAVLLRRAGAGLTSPLQRSLGAGYEDVPVIASLSELPALLLANPESRTPLAAPESDTSGPGGGGNPESRPS
ncbi:MAG: HAD family hydrolase [Acidobacteria bacterium]|nr:HAD family hydrolase [Acidobacteriota bacterium]